MAKNNNTFSLPNIDYRDPPPSLVALRNELPHHPEIYREASQGNTFEECLATIAYMLDIVLDGHYDVEPLCDLLYNELRRRGAILVDGVPSIVRDSRLVPATLLETDKGIHIERGTIHAEKVDGVMRTGILEETAPIITTLGNMGNQNVDKRGNVTESAATGTIITSGDGTSDVSGSNEAAIILPFNHKKKAVDNEGEDISGKRRGEQADKDTTET